MITSLSSFLPPGAFLITHPPPQGQVFVSPGRKTTCYVANYQNNHARACPLQKRGNPPLIPTGNNDGSYQMPGEPQILWSPGFGQWWRPCCKPVLELAVDQVCLSQTPRPTPIALA